MKIINPTVELIQQKQGFDGMLRHIEKCGRTCYKSEDKITDDSADTFVANLIKNKHYAMLEHGTVYLKHVAYNHSPLEKYKNNPYSIYKYFYLGKEEIEDGNDYDVDYKYTYYVTTNYRVLIENHWIDDLEYICEPTEFHVPRITLKFTTNIGVTREGNRMRANSIAEESTRYCNYSKNKFGEEITFIKPVWFDNMTKEQQESYKEMLQEAEDNYIILLNKWDNKRPDRRFKTGFKDNPLTPQQAREVLPLATKSEVVYTAFPHQWKHFFDLRLFGTTGKPHPNMEEIAKLAKKVLEENNLWKLIYSNTDKIQ